MAASCRGWMGGGRWYEALERRVGGAFYRPEGGRGMAPVVWMTDVLVMLNIGPVWELGDRGCSRCFGLLVDHDICCEGRIVVVTVTGLCM